MCYFSLNFSLNLSLNPLYSGYTHPDSLAIFENPNTSIEPTGQSCPGFMHYTTNPSSNSLLLAWMQIPNLLNSPSHLTDQCQKRCLPAASVQSWTFHLRDQIQYSWTESSWAGMGSIQSNIASTRVWCCASLALSSSRSVGILEPAFALSPSLSPASCG